MATGTDTAYLRQKLLASFAWLGDRWDESGPYADITGWWREPDLLSGVGPALASLFADQEPTVVLGLEARGYILGALAAAALDVGFVEVRKEAEPLADDDSWIVATTPPDYRDRQIELAARRILLRPGDRVLLVDDWVATGGQAMGARRIVEQSRAGWIGTAAIVDGLSDNRVRRDLNLRSLLHLRDLGHG